jgi:aspartate/methionine/tyrosine aminotransferase
MNQAAHADSINLGIGQLWKWFPVADEIKQKLHAITEQVTSTDGSTLLDYGPNAWTTDFRRAVADHQQWKDWKEYWPENVLSTIGVQNAMQIAIGTLNRLWATRVLIPEINFGIYKKIPAWFGMDVETYKLTWDFGIDLEHLSSILKEDDIVILNPVANPTGRVLHNQDLWELAAVLKEELPNGYVISDEIYDELVYDTGVSVWPFSSHFDRTITCNGVSKSGAMAWLRVWWIVSKDTKLIQAMTSFNTSQISSPSPLNQALALPVVEWNTEETIQWYRQKLLENRETATWVLDSMWLEYVPPKGSFYIFPQISDTIQDVRQACLDAAWNPEWVVVIPGEAFWAERNVRISLASTPEVFEEWMSRFQKLFS